MARSDIYPLFANESPADLMVTAGYLTQRDKDYKINPWLPDLIHYFTKGNLSGIQGIMGSLKRQQILLVHKYHHLIKRSINTYPSIMLWLLLGGYKYTLLGYNKINITSFVPDNESDNVKRQYLPLIVDAARKRNKAICLDLQRMHDVYNYSIALARELMSSHTKEKIADYVLRCITEYKLYKEEYLDFLLSYCPVLDERRLIYAIISFHHKRRRWVCQYVSLRALLDRYRETIPEYIYAPGYHDAPEEDLEQYISISRYVSHNYMNLEPYIIAKVRALRMARRWRKIVQARRGAAITSVS